MTMSQVCAIIVAQRVAYYAFFQLNDCIGVCCDTRCKTRQLLPWLIWQSYTAVATCVGICVWLRYNGLRYWFGSPLF